MSFQEGNRILGNSSTFTGQGILEIASQGLVEETQAINSSLQPSDITSVTDVLLSNFCSKNCEPVGFYYLNQLFSGTFKVVALEH